MNDSYKHEINSEIQEEPRKNFRQTIDAMSSLGVTTCNSEGLIKVGVYDPLDGEVILNTIVMDKYNAIRLFGDLFVYDVDIEDNMLRYTLLAPEEPEA